MARHESRGDPLLASSLPIPVPSGPATCSALLRPCIAACTGVVRPPHLCENPDAGFLIPFSPRFLQGLWHAFPSSSPRT